MGSETIGTWTVITVIGMPVLGAGFGLLWASMRENNKALWDMVNGLHGQLAAHKVECERRFARVEDLQRLEEKIEDRFDRLDEKLDRALARA